MHPPNEAPAVGKDGGSELDDPQRIDRRTKEPARVWQGQGDRVDPLLPIGTPKVQGVDWRRPPLLRRLKIIGSSANCTGDFVLRYVFRATPGGNLYHDDFRMTGAGVEDDLARLCRLCLAVGWNDFLVFSEQLHGRCCGGLTWGDRVLAYGAW